MGYLLNAYKKGDKSGKEKDAFNLFITSLLGNKDLGAAKSMSLSALNMEQKAPTKFVPSMFYMMMYLPQKPDVINGETFIDTTPLIWCTSSKGNVVGGINFNMIPNDVRASILDFVVSGYSDFYENIDDDKFDVNEKLASAMSNPEGLKAFFKAIKTQTGIDISPAYRQYNTSYIKFARLIEYDMWEYIPYLSFTDNFRGANLADIQASILKK